MGNILPMHTLPTAELTGASKARIAMFRSAASHDGWASKYELKPRSVGAFFGPRHLSSSSRRCQHLRQRVGRGLSLAFGEAGNSCVGWFCIQARSWSRVLKPARKFSGPQTFFHTAKLTDLFVASSRLGCDHAGIFCGHFRSVHRQSQHAVSRNYRRCLIRAGQASRP
jgi:hypothetical protein